MKRRYRTKPIEVEAMQFLGTPNSATNVLRSFPDLPGKFVADNDDGSTGVIRVGHLVIYRNCWIIRDDAGQVTIHSGQRFLQGYEVVA